MKIQLKRLNHIQICIPVGEEPRAREFYAKVLGLEEIEKPDALKPQGGLWFQAADVQLHISTEEIQARSKRHPAFEVEDLERVKEYLKSCGVRVREEIPVPGINRMSLYDPFDNRIELMEVMSDK